MRLQALAWLLASSLALAASCRPTPLEPPRGAPVETKKPVAKPCEVERDVLGLTLGTHRFRPRAVETLQISADGRVILTAGTGAELWDAKSGERLRELASWLGRSSLSADGRRVATVDSGLMSSGVKVIAVDTGELVTALPVKDDDAEEIALDRKGERLASASRSGEVTLHELAGGAPTRRISADEGDVEALAFSPQADLLAIAGSKGRLQLWSFATGDEPQLLDAGGASLTAVAFSPNGRRLATADSRGLVRVFAIDGAGQATPKRSLEAAIPGEPRELRGVAITDDGRRVLVGTWSGVIALFDPTRPDPLAVLAEGGLVASGVAFTPDGRFAMGGVFHGALRFWDAETGEERRYDQPGNLAEPDAIVWSADGHRALVAAGAAGADVWDMRCGEMTGRLAGHRRRVEQLVASRDGRRVATGGNDGWLRLWDGETLERLHEAQNHFGDVEALALSDDGTVVATGSREGAILVRDTKSFGIVFERPADDGADTVISLALAPARGLLLAGDVMGRVAWLDLASGAPLALREDDYPNNIRGIQLSPDGARVSTHASDRVRIFDAATSANTVTFKTSGWTISNVSWFADSRRIAFGDSDGRVWLADAIDGRVIAGGAIEDGDIAVVALHHDQSTLVTGQRDTTLKVWDVAALGAVPEEDRDRIEVTITPEAELATARSLPRPAHEQCGSKPSAGLPACALHRLGPPTFRLEESLREVGALTFSPDAG
ncbi:MAG: hypothetical protein KC731_17300, partial [Myxococcales bacterium]|nr:hypothetical protein [Myxococcales bacterium]